MMFLTKGNQVTNFFAKSLMYARKIILYFLKNKIHIYVFTFSRKVFKTAKSWLPFLKIFKKQPLNAIKRTFIGNQLFSR